MIEAEIEWRFRFLLVDGPEAVGAAQFSEVEMRRKLQGHDAVADAIIPKNLLVEQIRTIQPRTEPTRAFKTHHDLDVQRTAWPGPCASWFKRGDPNGALIMYLTPGRGRTFFELMRAPRHEDFSMDYLSSNRWSFLGNGFTMREFDGRDTTFWMGHLDGQDVQPTFKEKIRG